MNAKTVFSWSSIRTKLLLFSVITTLTLGLTSLYSHFNAKFFLDSLVMMFQRNSDILNLETKIESIESLLAEYLSTKSSESLLKYWKVSQEITESVWSVDRRPLQDEGHLIRKNIAFMTEAFLKLTEKAVAAKRGRDIPGYIKAYEDAEKVAEHLRTAIAQLNLKDFHTSLTLGSQVSRRLEVLQVLNNTLVFDLVALSLLLSFWFSWKLTQPMTKLSEAAREIAHGNYDVPLIVENRDETGLLAQTFNSMRLSIIRNIQELKEKAEIENGLMEERLKNLQMKNLLKIAELQTLQAQINPHFLFNTLNAGAQLAMMEEAEQTSLFLENFSDLLRHNIRQLDRPVFLSEEIRSLDSYVYLLKIRFADRFNFSKAVAPDYQDLKVPTMILQPLVENALIHGLRDTESGGRIRLSVHSEAGRTIVIVEDNGVGMTPEKIKKSLSGETESPPAQASQSTGIGLGNVIERLRLFFGTDEVVDIVSLPGEGTRIILKLTLPEEDPLV